MQLEILKFVGVPVQMLSVHHTCYSYNIFHFDLLDKRTNVKYPSITNNTPLVLSDIHNMINYIEILCRLSHMRDSKKQYLCTDKYMH